MLKLTIPSYTIANTEIATRVIYLAAHHIVSISPNSKGSFVGVSTDTEGSGVQVAESPEEIIRGF